MSVQTPRRLFTVEEFHQMAEAGIFGEDDRVELLSGEIVEMTPIGSRHAACLSRLNGIFVHRLGERFLVRIQDPIRLDDYSEPQPDLVVAKARSDFYRDAHPRAADVLLVIEVADSSAESDRLDKVPRYGRAGIPEVWLVDLVGERIDLYRSPTSDGYAEHEVMRSGGSLRASSIPEVDIAAVSVMV